MSLDTPDDVIEPKHREHMTAVAQVIDELFNGKLKHPNKNVGFVLLLFPYGDADKGKANYISNGASRQDIATLFRELAARFEGMPTAEGRG